MRRALRRPAFTLVELLIVVAIIALLISIGLPSLHRARRQAKGILCANNLREQGAALNMYFNEYNGAIPREVITPYGNRFPYAGLLLVEMGRRIDETNLVEKPLDEQFRLIEEFQCPDFPRGYKTILGRISDDQPLDFVFNDFHMNYESRVAEDLDELAPEVDPRAIPRLEYVPNHPAPIERVDLIRKPAAIIFLSEAHRNLPVLLGAHDVTRGAHLPRGKYPRVAVDLRHPAGIHSLYLDVHIERALPKKQTLEDWFDPTAHAVSR